MATKLYFRPISNLAIHPGEMLAEEIEFIGMTPRELAERMGMPAHMVNDIIKGKKSITHDTAAGLEDALDIPAHMWTNAQSTYDFTSARLKKRDQWKAQAAEGWLSRFPIGEIEKRGWIERYRDKADKAGALLQFLGHDSFHSWDKQGIEPVIGFRISENSKVAAGALSAWLRKGEIEGRAMKTSEYDEQAFRDAVSQIRAMTSDAPREFVPAVTRLCADAGVAVALVPELPKSGANGAARWLTPAKALIQMSLKWKWHDIFWFSFFHECCHILDHKVQKVYVDGISDGADDEAAANSFAADMLIPPNEWRHFVDAGFYDAADVMDFATQIGVHPGIVVGRMQHEDLIPHNWLTSLKERYEWAHP